MSGALPRDIRDHIKLKIWAKADEVDWQKISDIERAHWYENWSKDEEIGGVLAHFMDPRKVRVYIKDSLLKPYQCARLQQGVGKIFGALGLKRNELTIKKSFTKPHGCLLIDNRVICWGNSRYWKSVLFSVFERAYRTNSATPYAAALVETGNTNDEGVRAMVVDASRRLGLERLVWVE
jgi:hypothetical protein